MSFNTRFFHTNFACIYFSSFIMSSINTNATVTLTVNGKQAQDMLDKLKTKSVELEKAIENAAKAGDKTKLTKLQKELRQTNRQIAQIESATVGVEKVLRNLDKATPKELNKTLSTLKKQLNGIERGTEEWNRQCDAIKKVRKEIDRMNADLRTGENLWERFNRTMNNWQATIVGAAAAITGLVMAGRSAVKAYAEMDAEMANVRKFTGMTAEQVEDLNEEFKKMNTRTSREELNKLAEEAGRLGKTSKEDILGFVRAADKINVALDELGEGATLTLSKLTNIFGDEERLGTEKALIAVGSVINELSQNCTASAPYLANFAQRMAGVGAQARMTIPEIMGLAAVLDSQGQKVEMSSTAVSKVIMNMFKEQDKIIKATGLNAQKFKETVTKDTNEGLLMLLEQLHSLGNIDVLAPVFKDMGENGARASQVISALAGNIDMIKWEQQEANKAFEEATSVGKEYDVQNNTVQAGLDKARKRVKELAIELGQQLMPVMRHIMTSTTFMLKLLSSVVGFITRNKVEIIAATAALTAFAIATNLVAIRTKIATAAHLLWNVAVKTGNVLLPIAQVMLNGLKLTFERLIWQTRGANATQVAYNKSLAALKANAAAAKTAYGLMAVAIVGVSVALVKFIKANSDAAKAQRRLQEMEEAAGKACGEEVRQIEQLKKTIENNNLSIKNRQTAIEEMQKIIPGYHASLTDEGNLIGHNSKMIDIYVKQLKNMAMIKEAISRQTDLEFKYKKFEQETPENLMDAFFQEKTNGMDEAQAAAKANASLAAYRAWKAKMRKLDQEKEQLDGIIEARTKENQDLTDQTNELTVTPTGGSGLTGDTTNDTNNTKHEDKFKTEKEWKEKEEALNRIAYATGLKNYEDYTNRILDIETQYHQKILQRTDLTEKERLSAEVGYYEALQKAKEQQTKLTAEQENAFYQETVANQKQRYIDGEISQELYQETLELLELKHLKRMLSIYEVGTKEHLQAQRTYQDKLIQDQQRRQKETEENEKKHQQALQKLKEDYFGANSDERYSKYYADLQGLKEVYQIEIKTAGNNAKEKLRIEEAYLKAKLALRKKYGIDELEDQKNFLEIWNDDMQEWLQSDFGKAVTGSIETLSAGMGSIFSQLTSLIQAETDIQTAAIERRYKSEISNAEGNNYIVKQLEKKKQAEIAKLKDEANKKMFAMQVIQAVAQTAQNALSAYGSAAAIPVVGYILAPVAAAMAVAAGALQIAAIKKQQQASEAQGYAEGGFTPQGSKYDVAGVVHKGEWVASQKLLQSPVARPMIDALDYAQRTNTIGSLRSEDVSRSITPFYAQSHQSTPTVIVQPSTTDAQAEIAAGTAIKEYAAVIKQLKERLDEPFVTVNTVSGDNGIKQAQDEYNKLMRNKTPKSRRK